MIGIGKHDINPFRGNYCEADEYDFQTHALLCNEKRKSSSIHNARKRRRFNIADDSISDAVVTTTEAPKTG